MRNYRNDVTCCMNNYKSNNRSNKKKLKKETGTNFN